MNPIMNSARSAPLKSSSDSDDLGVPQSDIRRLPSSLGMAVDSLFDDTGVQSTVATPILDDPALSCPSETVFLHNDFGHSAASCIAELLDGLHDTIGEPLLTAYTAVKRHEAEHFKDAMLDSERQMLWHRY
jgi:hypothetical protein